MMKYFLMFSLLIFSTEIYAETWNEDNNPSHFNKIIGTRVVTDFATLPLSGKLNDDRLGWSESFWPANKGGIAYRWNHPNPMPFKYKLHTKEELKRMSMEEVGQLSPAELYDIAQGDYDYTLTRKVLRENSPKDLWWEGICHGWALAAANYPEPDQVVITNEDGIKIPFGASDIKALLALHDAYNYRGTYAHVGKRCSALGKVPGEGDERDSHPNAPGEAEATTGECRDINAGAFHVVLTNMIGIHSKSFVADVDRFNDVWNQPVTSYSSTVVGEEPVDALHREYGVDKRIRIQTVFTYGEELKFWTPELEAQGVTNFVSKKPVTGTIHQEFRHKTYEYIIELNSRGQVIGGEWLTETRPDFLWMITRDRSFNDSPYPLKGLNFIYRPVKR